MFSTLRFPATRLGKLMRADAVDKILELCEEFVPGDVPEYFFDKNPENFPAILDMYRAVRVTMLSANQMASAMMTDQ